MLHEGRETMKYLHPSELDRMGEKPPSPRAWPGHEATPSDLVFLSGLDWDRDLQGNRYAKKKIPKGDLYRSFVAAFLANETVGNIQLRLKESRFLWLIKT